MQNAVCTCWKLIKIDDFDQFDQWSRLLITKEVTQNDEANSVQNSNADIHEIIACHLAECFQAVILIPKRRIQRTQTPPRL